MNEFDTMLKEEIPAFREKGHAFQRKELTMMEYKHASGGFGVYAERGGEYFMIRLRVPSGVLSVDQLKLIYNYAKQYNLTEMHFTTRQTIQLHHLTNDQVCDIMEVALTEGIYTRGGGGNYPRNVSLSPLAGVAQDEVFDPTDFALMVNEHFLAKITSYHLPRKLKVSFSNNEKDTGNATFNDLGFLAVKKDDRAYFKLYLCGGLGNNPTVGIPYDELVDPKDVLYHVEAFTNFFMAEGNYENRNKARSRYIGMRLGPEETLRIYKEHYQKAKETLQLKELEATFTPCECEEKDFLYDLGIIPQRQKDLYTVVVHPVGGILSMDDAEKLIQFVEKIPNVSLRLSMDESLYVRNLSYDQAEALLDLTKDYNPQIRVHRSSCCIGVPTCQIGIGETQKALRAVLDYLKSKDICLDSLPYLHFSGCTNSCGTQQVAALGLAGCKKRIDGQMEDAYTIYAGGTSGEDETTLGATFGVILGRDLPEFIYQLAVKLEDANMEFEEYLSEKKEEFQALVNEFAC